MDQPRLMFLLLVVCLCLIQTSSTVSTNKPSDTEINPSKHTVTVNPLEHSIKFKESDAIDSPNHSSVKSGDTINPDKSHGRKRDVGYSESYDQSKNRRVNKRIGEEYGPPSNHPTSYYPHSHDPEPIIEIIIKDSNESLPAPPVYTAPPTKPTKEPVQVFYVKYKKNPNSQYGKEDEIIYEPPVPALTPPTNNHDLESATPPTHTVAYTTYAPLPPRPSTTLRTIIHPDSERYHGTGGVKVTFGKTEIHHGPPVLSHREDSDTTSSSDRVSKRDSQAAGSDLQPVRRNPEYRSPILNQNEFQALPPDYHKSKDGPFNGPFRNGNDYNVPNNAIGGDFNGPFKNGGPPRDFNGPPPQDFGGNNFDGRIRNGPPTSFDGGPPNKFIDGPPVRGGPSFDNGPRGQNFNGPPPGPQGRPQFDGPPRNGPQFDGPIRNGPHFDGPIRNERPPFDGPVRNNGPNNNFDGPVRNNVPRPDSYLPQGNNFSNRPTGPNPVTKVSFPNPQPYQRPPEIQTQGPRQPSQPLQPQYQQTVKPFVPSQPVYSPQELYQPPPQYQQSFTQEPINKRPPPPSQINGFQQNALKTPPMQHFSTNDVIRKPQVPSYDQSSFTKKPSNNNFVDQFLQSGPGSKTYISPVKQSTEIAAFDEPAVYSKPTYSSGGELKQQKQLYELQKQQEIERQQQAQLQQLQQQYYALQQQQQYATTLQQATQTESIPASFLQQNNYNNKPTTSGIYNGESLQQGSFSKPVTSIYNGESQLSSYNKPGTSSFNNVDQQNNLFVQNEDPLNSYKPGTELSNEEYQLLLEKQRLAQVKLLQKDREQYQQSTNNIVDQQRLQQQAQQQQQQQAQQQQEYQQQKQAQQQEYQQIQQQYQQQQQQQSSNLEQIQRQQQDQQRLQNHRTEQQQGQKGELAKYQTSKNKEPVYVKPITTTKYVSSTQPSVAKYSQSSTSQATTPATEVSTEFTKEQKEKYNKNLLALPDEVPEDIRQQLLSSGILGNADIQILDYDKVGDIPIENLPPEALANFYGGGGGAQKRNSVITKRSTDNLAKASDSVPEGRSVNMKVVKFDPNTPEGQQLAQSYLQSQQPQSAAYQSQTAAQDVTLDPVILNDSSYNRYLPLKVNGASFPLPNSPLLHNRRITSVVVLAPVDYDSVEHDSTQTGSADSSKPGTHDHRDGKAVQVAGVRFVSGNILNELIKNPTEGNYRHWLSAEKQFPVSKQSIVLLVSNPTNGPEQTPNKETVTKQVFMYDFNTDNISELNGDLTETFLQVAESNASSDELDNIYQHETHHHNTPSASPSQTNKELNKRQEDTTPSVTDSLSEKKDVIKRQS